MNDFFGRPLTEGAYVVYGGGGNSSGNYGMLLGRIVSVSDAAFRIVRLKATYPKYTVESVVIEPTYSRCESGGRYTIVMPPPDVVSLFESGVAGTLSQEDKKRAGSWLHKGTF